MNNYQEKRQAKINRFLALSEKISQESESKYNNASKLASVIPFGQPILIGHHSEGRDRRYRARIERLFENSFELQKKAEYYKNKAEATQHNNSISSDDPEAIQKIKDKIERIKDSNEKAKLANKAIKKAVILEQKINAYMLSGLSKEQAIKHYEFSLKYPYYETFRTDTAEIRRLQQRLEGLEKLKTLSNKSFMVNDVEIVDNVEQNRLQLKFPTKPSYETIQKLKKAGFRWSPTNNAWQAYRKQWNFNNAKQIILEAN